MTKTGSLLKQKRKAKGFSQNYLRRYLGLASPQYLSNCERGLCALGPETARKLSRKVGMTRLEYFDAAIDDFITRLEKKWPKQK